MGVVSEVGMGGGGLGSGGRGKEVMREGAWWKPRRVGEFFVGGNTLGKQQRRYWPEVVKRIEAAGEVRDGKGRGSGRGR